MKIIRELSVTGNYGTELYNLLLDLPRHILFNNEHNLREPLGIYNVSIVRVFRAFKNILKEIKNSKDDFIQIDLCHKELLDSIMAYIDDGYLIMKCFYPKVSVNKNIIFADEWLEEVDKNIIREYKDNIKPYRHRLALIVNKTKHNHARYCHVKCSSSFGSVLGYYIEGVTQDGVIEPNKDIHPKWNGQYTAISYNKDIRDQLVNLYFISHFMTHTIKKIINKKYGIYINNSPHQSKNDMQNIDFIKEVASLKELFFPDEYNDNLPQIIIRQGSIEFRKPAYMSYINKLIRPSNLRIQTTMTGDDVTKSWTLPYF